MTDLLRTEQDRFNAIVTGSPEMFYFEHQEITQVPAFRNGIFENRIDINPFGIPVYLNLQDNVGAGNFVRSRSDQISSAAAEFGVSADLVRAVLYTEMARGWYDSYNIFGSSTVLPGNINSRWEALIPGSDVTIESDNMRLTAKLLSEISKRLENPAPEDVYALYNGLSHDRTYVNAETKSTPYFLKWVLETKAWEKDAWQLPNVIPPCFAAGTPILLADGRNVAIEDIAPGMRVAAFDERGARGTGELTSGRVTRLIPGLTTEWIVLDDGTRVTPRHRYLCPPSDARGPAAAATFAPIADILGLTAGATHGSGLVVAADGAITRITGTLLRATDAGSDATWITPEPAVAGATLVKQAPVLGWRTYNFEVAGLHTYVAANDNTDCGVVCHAA